MIKQLIHSAQIDKEIMLRVGLRTIDSHSVPRFSQVQFLPQIATDLTEPGYQYFTF